MKNLFHSKLSFKRSILIVDDDYNSRASLGAVLSNEYELIYATNGLEALETLKNPSYQIAMVFLNLYLPIIDGFEFLKIVKQYENLTRIPIIGISTNKDDGLLALELGAVDCLFKPLDSPDLINKKTKFYIHARENEYVVKRTEKDSLTGLTTRTYFFEYISLFDTYYPNVKMDAIVVDIKKFRTINEMYGERFGDRLLISVAHSLLKLTDNCIGIASRASSGTFYLYLSSQENFREIIMNALNEAVSKLGNKHIEFYVGVKHCTDVMLSPEKRFDDALTAIQTNDDSSGNYVFVYDNQIKQKELFEERLVLEFEKSLANKEFKVFFQPKMIWTSDEPMLGSAEALVRWIHPEFGIINPAAFISLFERRGMIQKLDFYVWNESASYIAKWRDETGVILPISINVSRLDLLNDGMVDELYAIVKRHNLDVSSLILEVTESAYSSDDKIVIQRVKSLKDAGFTVEMDDFGIGYSSLHLLTSLPLDGLKIDMSFVRQMLTSEKSRKMVEIILDIARLINVVPIAEGVESIEQINALKSMGVYLFQGYYFDRPLPANDFYEKYIHINKK